MTQSADNCLFCKIVAGVVPAQRLHEDDLSIAFADIHPQAPTHVLVIPKEHLASTAHAAAAEHRALLGHLLGTAAQLAERLGLVHGYRLVVNTGPDGGQTVGHLHVHLLGGRPMHWPPG